MSEALNITVKSSAGTKYSIDIDSTATVLELKQKIATQSSIDADLQRLIYSGKVLKNEETLALYKIQTGHTIHLVKGAAKGVQAALDASRSNSAPAVQPSSTASAPSNASSGVPSTIAAGQGSFNPLADLTGARYAGYTQLPSASMFGPDGGMNGVAPDPEELERMMSSPGFQESMLSLLSNPQMLDFIIQQLPQLRALGPQARELMQSPFFRQMMSNPNLMRPMLQGAQGGAAGAGGFGGFPAPGVAGSGDLNAGSAGSDAAGAAASGTDSSAQTAANPFAGLFPGGAGAGAGGFDPALLAGLLGGSNQATPAAPADNRPPEERYESQLRQLNDMGFFDFDRNVEALRRTGGSVQGAIEYLLSSQ